MIAARCLLLTVALLTGGCISFDAGLAAGTDGRPDFTVGLHYAPRPKLVTPEK